MVVSAPVATAAGLGTHLPAAYMLMTVVVAVLAVGRAAMGRKIVAAGGAYAYVSHGLGRELGLAAGLGMVVAHGALALAMIGLFAVLAVAWLDAHLGIDAFLVWPAVLAIVVTGALGALDIRVSVVLLGVALALQLIALVAAAIGVLATTGGGNLSFEALNVLAVLPDRRVEAGAAAGGIAIGLPIVLRSWIGIETAPNYAEETRAPRRTVPRTVVLATVGLGVLYVLASWIIASALPAVGTPELGATREPAEFLLGPIGRLVSPWAGEAVAALVPLGALAGAVAFHGAAARVLYSLGRDGALPHVLGTTHDGFRSPNTASLALSAVSVPVLGLHAAYSLAEPAGLLSYAPAYADFSLLGLMLILIVEALVAVSVIVYFRKHHPEEAGYGRALLAPLGGLLAIAYLGYLLVGNRDAFGGGLGGLAPWLALAVVAGGFFWGLVLRAIAPERYRRIGRLVIVKTEP